MARVGYAAKALLYITVGLLAAQAGVGQRSRPVDPQGALRVFHDITFGRIVLLIIAAGLIGYAVWRVIEGIVDPDNRGADAKGVALRTSFAARGVVHAGLGITALRLALRERPEPHGDQTPEWTAAAFGLPAGVLLVWIVALGIGGYGVYQLYRAYASKLSRQLKLSQLGAGTRKWVIAVSRFGLAARGVVFCLIAYLLARAAAYHSPAQAGGVRKSLGLLARLGHWPFVVVSVGLIAYGVYELLNARYRQIRVA